MDVAVIGAGNVGLTLARAWQRGGLHVTLAVRDPEAERYEGLRAEFAVGTIAQSVPPADATLLAVPGARLPDLLSAQGAVLDGRLLLDATNVVGGDRLHQVDLLTQMLPRARVYRAFNTLGWENYASPGFDLGGTTVAPDLLFCGPDGPDLGQVEALISAVGLHPVRIGDLEAADTLDGLTRLWFALALGQGRGRHLAFRVLTDH
jgi:predicted dinucleotide-binding enzyme